MPDFRESTAMYLRKSRMDPECESIDETLARHEDTLTKLASRMGLNITGLYKEVVSGDGLFTRPEMVRLLQDVGSGRYTGVICMEIDRLGRSSQKDSGIIFETLKDNNVFIITPNKTYDLNDDIDEQSVEMQSFIARQELKSIKRRLRKGAEKSCEFGYHISDPPYGYRRVYVDKHPTLEICPDEAAVIRMVFDMYVNHNKGSHVIADELSRMGLHPRKNDHFSRNTIRFFLSNPIYTGKIVWNRRRHTRPKFIGDKNRITLNPEDKWIVADGVHPAIISKELFEKAQRIRETRSHPSSNNGTLKNPFAGLIYCKNCGRTMQRQFSKISGSRLLCTNTGCNRSIRTEYVEQYILYVIRLALEGQRADKDTLPADSTENRANEIRGIIAELTRNKAAAAAQKATLHDLLERGIYDAATFCQRTNTLTDRINNIDSAILAQRSRLEKLLAARAFDETETDLGKLSDGCIMLSAAEKNALYKKLFTRIEYLHTKEQKPYEFSLDIEWNYAL